MVVIVLIVLWLMSIIYLYWYLYWGYSYGLTREECKYWDKIGRAIACDDWEEFERLRQSRKRIQ
jgi:hypothetical protein